MATQQPSEAVDAFLAAVPEPSRSALQGLRRTLREVVPEAEEVISYGVPSLKVGGKGLVSFAAAKTQCSFYVQSPEVMEQFSAELASYKTSKGTVHFQADAPLPRDLVAKLVSARLAEIRRANSLARQPKGDAKRV